MLLIGKETDVEEDDSTAFQKKVDAIDASNHNRNVIDTTVSILFLKAITIYVGKWRLQ